MKKSNFFWKKQNWYIINTTRLISTRSAKKPRQNQKSQSIQVPQQHSEGKLQKTEGTKKQAKKQTVNMLKDSAATIDNQNRK